MKSIFRLVSVFAAVLLLSCEKTPAPAPIPSGLELSGEGFESANTQAMIPVAEGVWDIYARFKSGQVKVLETGGGEFISFRVSPLKEGVCRLRVKADKTWSLVHINKVSLVVTEGGVDNPKAGNKPPIEASYEGGGVWSVPKLYIATDHLRYRFELDTDTPAELKYWCATWDNAGTQPSAITPEYTAIRALGQEEYDALMLKDTRACWMFPADKYLLMANFTVSMNTASPSQEIAFVTPHTGPYAAFMGDSITWQWGTSPREISKDKIVIPLSPLPSWLEDKGNNVKVTWHPDFFTRNNYVDKGVSGQNTIQMLSRYKKDIIALDPQCVVIMAGTNDLAQGYSKQEILANIKNMAEQAEAEHMNVILCSITPCNDTYSNLSNPKTKGAHIVAVNDMIKAYAAQKGFIYCDYYPALVAEDGYSLKEAYWLYDHLHPNPDAYTVMEGIIKPIIDSLIQ